jgi:hypothetical protein
MGKVLMNPERTKLAMPLTELDTFSLFVDPHVWFGFELQPGNWWKHTSTFGSSWRDPVDLVVDWIAHG